MNPAPVKAMGEFVFRVTEAELRTWQKQERRLIQSDEERGEFSDIGKATLGIWGTV